MTMIPAKTKKQKKTIQRDKIKWIIVYKLFSILVAWFGLNMASFFRSSVASFATRFVYPMHLPSKRKCDDNEQEWMFFFSTPAPIAKTFNKMN